jgi:hypothetical protein
MAHVCKDNRSWHPNCYISGALAVKYRPEEQELLHERTSLSAVRTRCRLGVVPDTGDHARPVV